MQVKISVVGEASPIELEYLRAFSCFLGAVLNISRNEGRELMVRSMNRCSKLMDEYTKEKL